MKPLPYGRQWIDSKDEEAVLEALRSDWLTQGPRVEAFEEALAEAVGAKYAVAVSSGTAALHLAYLAVGVGSGDVVATSPITFVATANAAVFCGGRPEFVDIDPTSICLSPEALEAKLKTGLRPRLVVPVHFAGLPCDMQKIGELSQRYGFSVIEDACHALGSRYLLDNSWGRVGDCRASSAAVFSFHPVKHITTGEGGAVVTNDSHIADSVRRLRSHGIVRGGLLSECTRGPEGEPRPWYYEMQDIGFNYRITDLQSSLGLSQLRKLSRFVGRRAELAEQYSRKLRSLEDQGAMCRPQKLTDRTSSWHLYPVRIRRGRDRAFRELRARSIHTQVHYIPVHLQPFYRRRYGTAHGLCPQAEAYFGQALSLPLFPAMADSDVEWVATTLGDILGERE